MSTWVYRPVNFMAQVPAVADDTHMEISTTHLPISTVSLQMQDGSSPLSRVGRFFRSLVRAPQRKHRVILCIIAFVVVVALSIPIGYTQRTPDYSLSALVSPTNDSSHILQLGSELVSIDVDGGTAIFDWFIFFDSQCNYDNDANIVDCPSANPNSTVDIFVDPNTLSLSDGSDLAKNASDNVASTPIFRHNATANLDPRGSQPSFRTTLRIATYTQKRSASLSSLQNYPFDVYFSQIFMFASDSSTGASVSLTALYTSGVAVGYQTVGIPVPGEEWRNFIFQRIQITRSGLVKSFVMVIILTVWLVTLMFTFLTICIICGYEFDISLLLIPIVTLFTITQMRSSMPGAPPGFGAIIDFVGTLPCLALTSMSATIIICLLVFRSTHNAGLVADEKGELPRKIHH